MCFMKVSLYRAVGGWGGVGWEMRPCGGVGGRVKPLTAVTVVQGALGAEPASAPSERK